MLIIASVHLHAGFLRGAPQDPKGRKLVAGLHQGLQADVDEIREDIFAPCGL
jgi:hypothetical protein